MVDGIKVYEVELSYDLDLVCIGRFGIGVQNSAVSFDDFRYVGENRVTPGARYYVPLQFLGEDIDSYGKAASVESGIGGHVGAVITFHQDLDDGTVYGLTSGYTNTDGHIKTKDNGKTWERAYGGPFASDVWSNTCELPDGTLVAYYQKYGGECDPDDLPREKPYTTEQEFYDRELSVNYQLCKHGQITYPYEPQGLYL